MRFAWVLGLALIPLVAQAAPKFILTSPNFSNGATLPMAQVNARPACGSGGDRSPALNWTTPPAGATSLAITLFDPDARGRKGWWHWALFNLPPNLQALPANAGRPGATDLAKTARETRNSFGAIGYGGACPPPGDKAHHYAFVLWAVGKSAPPFEAGASAEAVDTWLRKHAIGHADLVARYGR